MTNQRRMSRRMLLGGSIGLAGLASSLVALSINPQSVHASSALPHPPVYNTSDMPDMPGMDMGSNATVGLTPSMVGLPYQAGDVSPKLNGFDPAQMLTTFDPGKVSTLPSGQTVRDYTLTATDKMIYLGPKVVLAGSVYNGRLPGPYLRATQGDHIRITFINNSTVSHSINFSGLHPSNPPGKMPDMAFQPVPKGGHTIYEFDAIQFGLHMYQSFANPMTFATLRGLFGMIIIDPPQPRPKATELAMIMSASPLKVDLKDNTPDNDIYAVNAVAYQFFKHPYPLRVNEPIRVYLGNATEFDRINSFHLHANLFNLYRSGTSLTPDELTDTVILCHGQTAILEFTFKFPGQYMFHAHQAEFSDKGWTSAFNVTP